MKTSKYRTPGITAAAVVLGSALAAAAVGSSTAPAQTEHAPAARTLHLVERGGGLKVVDNPPKARHQYDFSAGDIVTVTRDITTPRGGRVGSLRLVCIATDATTQQCNGTETFPAGTLELAGTSAPHPTTTVAVIGGTGVYAGAHGTSVSGDRKTNADIADQTVTLLP